MSLEPGTRVGRYTISRLIAQGGMAEVYRAEQDLTGGISRPVAVKVIRPEYSESSDFREMFLDEARTACTLSHPNIVHIYEVGESDDGLLYMAMELVSGETLATVNRTLREYEERFSDEALFAIGIHCCSALEAVHALKIEGGVANLVHRDVSPHNLLLSTGGALKLIDFGIAKAASNRNLTMPGVTKGKAGYFSPEQAMGKKLDGRSDLFSLGITLYKLASGHTPFDEHKSHVDRHAALVRGQWKDLDETYPGLPKGFYDAIRRSLAVKPDDRFQTARAMREALEKAAFDAHIRVSQSSLEGYLDEDGEVTADGGSRSSVAPRVSMTALDPVNSPAVAPPNENSVRAPNPLNQPRPKHTDTLVPASEGGPKKGLLIGAFIAAVLIGVGVTVGILSAASDDTTTPPQPVVVAKTSQPEPKPVVVAKVDVQPPPVMEDARVIDAGETVVTIDEPQTSPTPRAPVVTTPPKKQPKAVVAVVRPPSPEKPPEAEKPPPVGKDEPIPEGEGRLSISVKGSPAATLTVQGETWDTPPVQRRLNSGRYRVTIKLPNGAQATVMAAVMPDKKTELMLDPASLKWSQSLK
ncbi:MAG: serine/threonine protein kinase [Archangium sp.]